MNIPVLSTKFWPSRGCHPPTHTHTPTQSFALGADFEVNCYPKDQFWRDSSKFLRIGPTQRFALGRANFFAPSSDPPGFGGRKHCILSYLMASHLYRRLIGWGEILCNVVTCGSLSSPNDHWTKAKLASQKPYTPLIQYCISWVTMFVPHLWCRLLLRRIQTTPSRKPLDCDSSIS